jgi:PIN domain nuclease of toxin-antitoxin system
VRFLLDTHAFLWWMEGSRALGPAARAAIADPANEVVFSIASSWELTIKSALGKLRFPADLETTLRDEGFGVLPVTFAHLRELAALPPLHKDPFDRMLIAQSRSDGLAIVTADPAFAPYGPAIIW